MTGDGPEWTTVLVASALGVGVVGFLVTMVRDLRRAPEGQPFDVLGLLLLAALVIGMVDSQLRRGFIPRPWFVFGLVLAAVLARRGVSWWRTRSLRR